MEIGLYTFVENTDHPSQPRRSPEQRVADLLEEIELADQVGLDVFAIGEHHREEYVASAPAVLLAAAAARTNRIRLSSAVNVLSSDDPVRIYQQFATIDLISQGRAEIMVGRGSFIESFPLFGYDLREYDRLFAEKLDLLLQVREQTIVHWAGETRPAIEGRGVYPRALQDPLPVWVAVGGTPQSAWRTGMLGLPMALAIIGGIPARFQPLVELHRRGAAEAGKPQPALSINSHGFIADDRKKALTDAFPAFKLTMDKIGRERGWPPLTREQFEASTELYGANFVGTPDEIVEKILWQHEIFGHERFLLQLTVGSMPHRDVLRAIELLGTKVKPAVVKALANA